MELLKQLSRKNAERARAFGDRRGLVDFDDEADKRSLREKRVLILEL